MNEQGRRWVPHLSIPRCFPLAGTDHVAFWLGTGFGSGLLRPAPGTWGSVVGMGYLFLWTKLPHWSLQVGLIVLSHLISVWSAGRCEKLLGEKDPGSVVIDEIVVVPLAFYPLLSFQDTRWWVWLVAFGVYRLFDIVKPWPGRRLEALGGGLGIVADDVSSALYTAFFLWGMEATLRWT